MKEKPEFQALGPDVKLPILRPTAIQQTSLLMDSGVDFPSHDPQYTLGEPFHEPEKKVEESPGYISTFVHKALGLPAAAYEQIADESSFYRRGLSNIFNNNSEPRTDGWTSGSNKQMYESVPEKYWGVLHDAHTPEQQQRFFENISHEIEQDEYYSRGPFAAKLAGGLAEFYSSGAAFLGIAARSVEYANMARTVTMNTLYNLPKTSAEVAWMTGVDQARNITGDAEEFGTNFLTGLAFASVIHPAFEGLRLRGKQRATADTIEAVSKMDPDIGVRPVVGENGEIKKYEAYDNSSDKSLSADKVKLWSDYVDSRINKSTVVESEGMKYFFGNKAFGSMTYRLATSNIPGVRDLVRRMTYNELTSAGEAEGGTRPMTAVEYRNKALKAAVQVANNVEGAFYRFAGLGDKVSFLSTSKGLFLKDRATMTQLRDDFMKKFYGEIYDNIPSGNEHVMSAVSQWKAYAENVNLELGRIHGVNGPYFKDIKNVYSYFPMTHDLGKLKAGEVNANGHPLVEIIANHLMERSGVINALKAKIAENTSNERLIEDRLNKSMDSLFETLINKNYYAEIKAKNADNLSFLESPEKAAKRAFADESYAMANEYQEIIKGLRENAGKMDAIRRETMKDPAFRDALENPEIYDEGLLEQFETHLSQLTAAESEIKVSESLLEKATTKLKEFQNKITDPETYGKTDKRLARSSARRVELEAKVQEYEYQVKIAEAFKGKAEAERAKLHEEAVERARRGEMPRDLFDILPDGKIEFIDPFKKPRLFEAFEERLEAEDYAKQYIDNVLQNTEEDIAAQLHGGAANKPTNSFMRRQRMIPASLLAKSGYLTNNIGSAVIGYGSHASKLLGYMQAFKGTPSDMSGDFSYNLKSQVEELKNQERAKTKDPKKLLKAFEKIDKELQSSLADIKLMHDIYFGRAQDAASKKVANGIKAYTSSTLLGAMPLSMMTEPANIAGGHGWEFMLHGLKNMVAQAAYALGKESKSVARGYAEDAQVGFNKVTALLNYAMYSADRQTQAARGMPFSRRLNTVSELVGNASLANQFQDMFHTWTASIVQSRIMRNMLAYEKNGKINDGEDKWMRSIGIDAKVHAKDFVEQYNTHGFKDGGYESNYTKWDNRRAYKTMSDGIYRDVMRTHTESNPMDSPSWTNKNPYINLLWQFKGWGWSFFARQTLPGIQDPTGSRALQMFMAMGLGLLQEPLRAWINGDEFDIKDEHAWLYKAISNAGIIAPLTEALNTANIITGGNLAPNMMPQKFKHIDKLGGVIGPAGSVFGKVADIIQDGWDGKISQKSLRKVGQLIPGAYIWETRRISNSLADLIGDSMGIPKESRQQQGWWWWQKMKDAAKEQQMQRG